MVLLWSTAALAATWFVAPDGTGDFTSIQDALDASGSEDAIVVSPGTYNEGSAYNATYAGGLVVDHAVSIIGSGPGEVIVNVNISASFGRGSAVMLEPTAHDLYIEGITFLHSATGSISSTSARGYTAVTAVAAANGSATFRNVVFSMPVDTNRALLETGSGNMDIVFDQVTADFGTGSTQALIGVINTLGSESAITNSILYNTSGTTDAEEDPEISVRYSDLFGFAGAGDYGTGNINADPLFTNRGSQDWTLQSSSPAIDAGDPGTSDTDGTVADMGAFGGDADSYPVDDDGDGYYTGVGLGGEPDCDDSDSNVNPGADEVCDKVDNDCDNDTDEPSALDAQTWYYDSDGDGYGVFDDAVVECFAPTNYADKAGDCDDENRATAPGSQEYCNDIDDNCNDVIDDNASDAKTWYADSDNDGYGDDSSTVVSCSQPSGYINVGTDCDDTNADLWLNVPDLPASCEQTSTKEPAVEEGCSALPSPARGAWWISLAALVLVVRRRR